MPNLDFGRAINFREENREAWRNAVAHMREEIERNKRQLDEERLAAQYDAEDARKRLKYSYVMPAT